MVFLAVFLHGHPKLVQNCPNLAAYCLAHLGDHMREQKVLLHPPEKWIFGQKMAKFGPKLAFLAKYQHFWPICSHADQKTMRTSCPGVFFIM